MRGTGGLLEGKLCILEECICKAKLEADRKEGRQASDHAKRGGQRETGKRTLLYKPARSVSVHAPVSSSHSCGPRPTHQTLLPLHHLGISKYSRLIKKTNKETNKFHFIYIIGADKILIQNSNPLFELSLKT